MAHMHFRECAVARGGNLVLRWCGMQALPAEKPEVVFCCGLGAALAYPITRWVRQVLSILPAAPRFAERFGAINDLATHAS